jgi:DNA-binding phage protein
MYVRTKLKDGDVSWVLALFGRVARPGGEARLAVEYRLERLKPEKAL